MKESIRAVIQAQVTQPTTRADLITQAQRIEENEIVRTRDRPGGSQRSSAPGPYRSKRDNRNRYDPTRGRDNRNREGDKDRSRSEQVNHRVHKAHGCEIRYLPPYSPDFNSIELSFRILNAWVRKYFGTLWPVF
ncbi:hypothetical protein MMC07_007977 [Pseudocyphellaria aurata]|nr:hypothetical protein [Pseudocyphellaria aurata]